MFTEVNKSELKARLDKAGVPLKKRPWFLHAASNPRVKSLSSIIAEANKSLHATSGSAGSGGTAKTAATKLKARQMTKATASPGVQSSSSFDEAEFNYQDRIPEMLNWDFQKVIETATGGSIGEGSPWGAMKLNDGIAGTGLQVAIIGAGAAGLTAGYELMKVGLQPVFFEMQLDPNASDYVRPCGRGFSWDFTCDASPDSVNDGGGFTSWYPTEVTGPEPTDNNISSFNAGRQFVDMGAMRYPADHICLHTYVDGIFASDYYYSSTDTDSEYGAVSSVWRPWRDPGVYISSSTTGEPSPNDKLEFPTAIYTTGIASDANVSTKTRGFYRMDTGTTLGEANAAVQNLTQQNWNLLYADDGQSGPVNGYGYLYELVQLYTQYTADMTSGASAETISADINAIRTAWYYLNDQFQDKSLWEVLNEAPNNWNDLSAYPDGFTTNPAQPTLQEMFGEIGIGSGGFDVFWWTTFMETLRIRIHLDEVNQSAFVGGTSYMLSPFLTHNVNVRTGDDTFAQTNLWTASQNHIVVDPVVKVEPRGTDADARGVIITTRNTATGAENSYEFLACILTASPSAIRSRIQIDESLLPNDTLRGLRSMRLTNCGKIVINFPNIPGQTYSQAFWMNRTQSDPYNTSNDSIVTTITDMNVRSVYVFDNYNWGTFDNNDQALLKAGSLLLSYTWDYNTDAFNPLSPEEQVRTAWAQVKTIYADGGVTLDDNYVSWALSNKQYQVINWTNVDGFAGGYRMSDPGENLQDQPSGSTTRESNQGAMWWSCATGYNYDTYHFTGFMLAGEAVAWLGLSGWVEGAMETGLAAACATVYMINNFSQYAPSAQVGPTSCSFCLPMLPGEVQYAPADTCR